MPKFMKNFSMIFAKKRDIWSTEFAEKEVNQRSGKLKGLMGHLQTFYTDNHDTMVVVAQKIQQL